MSNKQSSVEWLFEQQFNSFEKFNNGEFSFAEYMTHNLKLRQQAKTMHKDEIANAYISGVISEMNNPLDAMNYKIDGEEYYNETFRSQTTLEQEGEQ